MSSCESTPINGHASFHSYFVHFLTCAPLCSTFSVLSLAEGAHSATRRRSMHWKKKGMLKMRINLGKNPRKTVRSTRSSIRKSAKAGQIPLFKTDTQTFFGGILLKNRRKGLRPLSTKNAIHLVMKSSLARGTKSFRHTANLRPLRRMIECECRKWGIRLYRLAINFNHIHFVILIPNRTIYKKFISSLTCKISFKVGHARKGVKCGRKRSFFDERPFTRILAWGRDFRHVSEYLERNILEAIGFVAYKPRVDFYARYSTEGALSRTEGAHALDGAPG